MIVYPSEKTEDAVLAEPNANASPYNPFRNQPGPSSSNPRQGAYDDLPPPYEGPSQSRGTLPGGRAGESSSGSPSMFGRMRGFASGTSPADILNPPPPAFSRPPSGHVSYAPFPPCMLLSVNKELTTGFPTIPPPSPVQPHPFTMHDVREEDWVRFLEDVKRAGALSPMNRVVSNVAPIAMGMPLVGGLLASRAIERRMKRGKLGPVSEIVESWNHYFFSPRQMEVTLTHRDPSRQEDDDTSSSSSPSSSSDSDSDYVRKPSIMPTIHLGRADASRAERRQRKIERREARTVRRAERQARRAVRRAERQTRRAVRRGGRREGRMQHGDRWYLVVSYKSPGAYTHV